MECLSVFKKHLHKKKVGKSHESWCNSKIILCSTSSRIHLAITPIKVGILMDKYFNNYAFIMKWAISWQVVYNCQNLSILPSYYLSNLSLSLDLHCSTTELVPHCFSFAQLKRDSNNLFIFGFNSCLLHKLKIISFFFSGLVLWNTVLVMSLFSQTFVIFLLPTA